MAGQTDLALLKVSFKYIFLLGIIKLKSPASDLIEGFRGEGFLVLDPLLKERGWIMQWDIIAH